MITIHKYLDIYPIQRKSKILLLGTIHPHDTQVFRIPFFYGNRNSVWNILSDVFPGELTQPISLEKVISFLNERNISVSDTIRKCRRIKPTALDKDLIPEILNKEIVEQIRDSNIEKILCTSGFAKNNAFKLFYENILGLKITSEIRISKIAELDTKVFGRPVTVIVLPSPSGASNIGLSKNDNYLQNALKYSNSTRPVYDFKVDCYKEILQDKK